MKTETINFQSFLNGNWKIKNQKYLWKFFSFVPYPITSRFMQQESFRKSGHSGYDFAMPKNTPLRSIKDGEVYKIVDYGNVNAGKTVMIQWQDGKIAIYGHLNKFANIKEGEQINAGEIIGFSGNTGNVVGQNGYHLHFGLKTPDGQFIDPKPYVDLIQNMNNPKYIAKYFNVDKVPEVVEKVNYKTYTLQEIIKEQMESIGSLNNLFKNVNGDLGTILFDNFFFF